MRKNYADNEKNRLQNKNNILNERGFKKIKVKGQHYDRINIPIAQ